MFFRQVLNRDLGCASYLLADGGEAAVVDPRWDIDVYLEIAEAEGLRIAHVLDTHDHADHVSGRQRLAAATGACAYRPDPAVPGALSSDTVVEIGALRIWPVPTPGHRPEHTAFAVADLSRSPEPWLLLTGDSLLVGDVARPDLACEAADGAHALHASLARLVAQQDHVEVWPAHIGGSLCGGAGLSGKTSSTVGFERRHNPLLSMAEDRFVSVLTDSLPTRPPNIERIVGLNRRSEAVDAIHLPRLDGGELRSLLADGITVLDSRRPEAFDTGHLAGSINLPVTSAGVGTRAGWALEPEQGLILVAVDAASAQDMSRALQSVGFRRLAGWAAGDPLAWAQADLPVATAGSWDLDRLAEGLRADAVELVDVREASEWAAGHVRGSVHVPLRRLRDVSSVPIPNRGRTTAVACAAGVRAAFAASLLRRAGRLDVVRVADGGVPDLGARGMDLELGLG